MLLHVREYTAIFKMCTDELFMCILYWVILIEDIQFVSFTACWKLVQKKAQNYLDY